MICVQSGTHLWLILLKAHAALRAHAESQVHSMGLGFSEFAVLEVLLHKGPLPVNTIGARVRLTSGSITAAVDRLEVQKLVERCSHATDRRARMVHLTDAGRQLAENAFAAHEAAMERATAGLSPEECAQAEALLKKLGLFAASLEPLTPAPPEPVLPSIK
jgi:MarR family 2-MHQ and catechol resistance regulon transcriptional repressor